MLRSCIFVIYRHASTPPCSSKAGFCWIVLAIDDIDTLLFSWLRRWVTLNHYIATSSKICCTFCTLCTWKNFNKADTIYSFSACYIDVICISEHELSFKNAHTPSCIKAPLLLRITVRHTNIKAIVCSKTTCFAKFRGTLRKNRGAIFSNGAAIFPNGASIFSNGATVWLNFLENSEP